jgi:hypothetical protein
VASVSNRPVTSTEKTQELITIASNCSRRVPSFRKKERQRKVSKQLITNRNVETFNNIPSLRYKSSKEMPFQDGDSNGRKMNYCKGILEATVSAVWLI